MVEQALVDVTDLLHPEGTEGERPALAPARHLDLEHLERIENVKHHAVGDPQRAASNRLEERIAIGVEEPAAIARQAYAVVRPRRVEPAAVAEHRLLHLLRDHRSHLAEHLADRLHLDDRPGEELEVALEFSDGDVRDAGMVVPLRGEVVDEHLGRALSVAVDAAVALLEAVGIPRDLVVDQPVAVVLEVDALARRVCREQDPDRGLVGVGLERGFDPRALVGVHAAVEEHGALALGEPAGGQQVVEGTLGVAVLGEDDKALVAEPAAGAARVLDQLDQRLGLHVGACRCAVGPTGEALE